MIGRVASEEEPRIAVVIPAHNEAPRIAAVIAGLKEAILNARIIAVDDGSADGTASVARDAGAYVLRLPYNMGYGSALQAGYKCAKRGGADYLIQIDADGQHNPADAKRLLAVVQEDRADVCFGSRFLEGEPYKISTARRLGMALFRRVASAVLRQTITDPTSGFQAMNARVIDHFCRDSYPHDYPDTDVIVWLHRHGFRIAEIPVQMAAGEGKESMHSGLRPVYYLFKMALTIPLNLIRKEE